MSKPNALLTQKQRGFLQASAEERKEEYTKQQRSYHRREIRNRVQAGIEDFDLLFEHVEKPERERIFSEIATEDEDDPTVRWFPSETYAKIFAFLYLGLSETWGTFDDTLKYGIRLGERCRMSRDASRQKEIIVDYNGIRYVDRNTVDIDRVLEKMENKETHEIPDGELRSFLYYFATAPGFDPEIMRELMRERLVAHPPDDEDEDTIVPVSDRESQVRNFPVDGNHEEMDANE